MKRNDASRLELLRRMNCRCSLLTREGRVSRVVCRGRGGQAADGGWRKVGECGGGYQLRYGVGEV